MAPTCPPTCEADEVCTQIAQSCTQCASTECVKIPDSGATDTGEVGRSSKGPNIGAIVGGVAGGLVLIAIITFLVWKFFIKKRQQEVDDGSYDEDGVGGEKSYDDYDPTRDIRASTHTSASRASTALTRSSNVIQIAYIPGVTNRSAPGEPQSPGLLVPPVPPIPMATGSNGSSYAGEDKHYLMPDYADSISGMSLATGADSHGRQSISPSLARSSVATTVYQHNAIVSPTPAQTVVRGKAAVVSVRPGQANNSSDVPGVSSIQPNSHLSPPDQVVPTSPQRQAASGSGMNLSTQMRTGRRQGHSRGGSLQSIQERAGTEAGAASDRSHSGQSNRNYDKPAPLSLTKPSGWSKAPTVGNAPGSPNTWLAPLSATGEDSMPSSARPLMDGAYGGRQSNVTTIQDTPALDQSPFADNAAQPSPGSSPGIGSEEGLTPRSYSPQDLSSSGSSRDNGGPRAGKENMGKLAVVIEEAMKRASSVPVHGGLGSSRDREQSPFSDENTVDR